MKLHTVKGSPNGRKVEAVIRHLGLTVEFVHHDFRSGGLSTPQFRALNANGMVPVLVDGSFVLWESNAILQYLADFAGDGDLFPRAAQPRADVVRWLSWELSHFNKAFGVVAFETVAKQKLGLGPADAPLVEMALADLERFAPVLEAHLPGRRFVVGEGVTIADYAVGMFEAYRVPVPFDWSRFPLINAYFDRIHALEPWAATAALPVAARGRPAAVAAPPAELLYPRRAGATSCGE